LGGSSFPRTVTLRSGAGIRMRCWQRGHVALWPAFSAGTVNEALQVGQAKRIMGKLFLGDRRVVQVSRGAQRGAAESTSTPREANSTGTPAVPATRAAGMS